MPTRQRLASIVGAALCLLGGCGTVNSMLGGNSEKEALAAMEWSYGKDAIQLQLQADPRLNQHDGAAHTLVLGVAQFVEPNQFKALLADPGAVARLLESGKAPGLIAFERFIVEPGRARTVTLDRAQQAQYYGVIAGYYELEPLQNGRLFRIPVEVKSSGLISRTRTAAPAPQRVRLVLGPERILAAEQLDDKGEILPAYALDPPPRKGEGSAAIKVDADSVMQAADLVNAARRIAQ